MHTRSLLAASALLLAALGCRDDAGSATEPPAVPRAVNAAAVTSPLLRTSARRHHHGGVSGQHSRLLPSTNHPRLRWWHQGSQTGFGELVLLHGAMNVLVLTFSLQARVRDRCVATTDYRSYRDEE
jgi:hypothetical protein